MSPALAYIVTAALPDETVRDEYVRWLRDGHLAAVVAGGAVRAELVQVDRDTEGDPYRVQSSYLFPSREAFDTYVREHAPALRADGLLRFPPERGVAYTRTVGVVPFALTLGPQDKAGGGLFPEAR